MNFIEALEKATNTSTTENGAIGYATTGKALVDFNFKIPSYRNKRNSNKLIVDFAKVWNEDKELAIKYLFYLRDIRGGIGERDSFRACIKELILTGELDGRVFNWIMEYGRADDLFVFFDTALEKEMVEFVIKTLEQDCINYANNKPVSLLAKWMPSINTSSKATKALAKKFITAMEVSEKDYRKVLSKLRAYIDVVEKKLCANEWDKVKYETVPSMANLKYANAFMTHDFARRAEYLTALKKGETKINSSTCFPHDIVLNYRAKPEHPWDGGKAAPYNEALEQMWKALPNYLENAANKNILVVRDGSGSMTNKLPSSPVTALDVADALSIYFSERNSGPFKDKLVTFSERPKFIDLSKLSNLRSKLLELQNHDEVANTNIEAVFEMVLKVAVDNNLKQDEIPSILIISDMEFDDCTCSNDDTIPGDQVNKALFKIIESKFNEHGYSLPKLIFWNVNSRTNTIPLTQNELGVALLSGFSTAISKMALSNELDPYKIIVEQLNSERYKQVTLN